jgi:YcaO-like protein with predicted kinase domain
MDAIVNLPNAQRGGISQTVQTRSPYSDRVCPPSETIKRMLPHLKSLGITRIAAQTGLDEIGIPCFAAIRPNATTIAATQGKGLDADSAKASASMEAFEYAIAERPTAPRRRASVAEFKANGERFFWPERLLPQGTLVDEGRPIIWLTGYDHFSAQPVLVPYDVVAIGHEGIDLPGVSISTNGLASGNSRREAVFHALCELIERDACALVVLGSDGEIARTQVQPGAFGDARIAELVRRISDAGCALTLFNVTSNLGVPTFQAVIFDDVVESGRHFDLSAGAGTHPVAVRAAIRAITEAAQTRITNIAGARDDFSPEEYRFALDPSLLIYRGGSAVGGQSLPAGCPMGSSAQQLDAYLDAALRHRKVNEVIVVPVGGDAFGGAVIKVFAPRLEDKGPNSNWRPGPRALSAMLRSLA